MRRSFKNCQTQTSQDASSKYTQIQTISQFKSSLLRCTIKREERLLITKFLFVSQKVQISFQFILLETYGYVCINMLINKLTNQATTSSHYDSNHPPHQVRAANQTTTSRVKGNIQSNKNIQRWKKDNISLTLIAHVLTVNLNLTLKYGEAHRQKVHIHWQIMQLKIK